MIATDCFVLGVDGGGTHTRCAVVSMAGGVLGRGEAGPSNYLRVGLEAATGSVFEAVHRATAEAGVELPAVTAAICLAGVGRPANHAAMLGRLEGVARSVLLDTDAAAALAGAHALRPGIVVIAGTGAIAYGKDASGRVVRCDGWGPLLGDEGGGYWIGAEVLRAVARAADGRDSPTALTEAVLAHLGLEGPAGLVDRFRWGQYGGAEVAELAGVCGGVAAGGDAAAGDILRRAGERLAETCLAAAQQLGDALPPSVAVTGGVLGAPLVFGAFAAAVVAGLPGAPVRGCRLPPVLGAALLAPQCAGVQATETVLANLSTEDGGS